MHASFVPTAEVVATWPKPNYINPETRGPAVPVICGILGSVALAVVVARIRSRFFIQRNSGLDDWVFLAALPFVLAESVLVSLAVTKYKYDVHIWDRPPEMKSDAIKIMTACCATYVLAICPIRISVLLFYRRLATKTVPAIFTYTIWFSMSLEVMFVGTCISTLCFPCHPANSQWLSAIPGWAATHEFSCFDTGEALFSFACIGVTQDVIAMALPFSLVVRLNLPRRQKLALYCTFAGGILVCTIGILRAAAIYNMVWRTQDTTWAWYLFGGASNIEVLFATIFASVPALKYYFRKHFEPRGPHSNAHFLEQRDRNSLFNSKSFFSSKSSTSYSKGSALDSDTDGGSIDDCRPMPGRYVSSLDVEGKGLRQSVLESELMEDGIITEAALRFDTTYPPSRTKSRVIPGEEEVE